jgi:hypothetical protein
VEQRPCQDRHGVAKWFYRLVLPVDAGCEFDHTVTGLPGNWRRLQPAFLKRRYAAVADIRR